MGTGQLQDFVNDNQNQSSYYQEASLEKKKIIRILQKFYLYLKQGFLGISITKAILKL